MIDRVGQTIGGFRVDDFYDNDNPRRGYWLVCPEGHRFFATVDKVESGQVPCPICYTGEKQ